MSAQRLSDKNVKKWAARLGLDVIRMWSHGGYSFAFVTADHRHGVVDTKTGEWEIDASPLHYTSCRELFSDTGWQEAERARVALLHQPYHQATGCACGQ